MNNSDEQLLLRFAIEHTLLKPDTHITQIEKLCKEAAEFGFGAVCVPPYFLDDVVELLGETQIQIATVIGFPFGYNSIMSKFEEAENAIAHGAHHLDIVLNIAAIKNADYDLVSNEMEMFTKLAHSEGKIVKYIAETGLLNEIEIDLVCKLANDYSVDYIKTSTGILAPGADIETVQTLRKLLDKKIKIKASGGIRTKQQALEFLAAGADRIGTSNGVAIMQDNVQMH
ncbi:MAG: deoxyribose-phosphate aldolase [Chitinophagales bacterium]